MRFFRFNFVPLLLVFSISLHAVELNIIEKKIRVNGKEAPILAVEQTDGTPGAKFLKGQQFDVKLNNTLNVPSTLHWHGLILPNDQDGVAFITQYPIYPSQFYQYKFPLVQTGTYWMHSHYGLQEQQQLSGPLIIADLDDDKIANQDVVLLLSDFSFKSPTAIYENLRCQNFGKGKMNMEMSGKGQMSKPDIVEVDYDAYLTNNRTLSDPQIVQVNPGSKVRLRIINGSSATNFFINLGNITGEAIAVDGSGIKPFSDSKFELADAQRIDIVIQIPNSGGAFPILAQAEGTDKQTGLILTTKDAQLPKIFEKAPQSVGALTNAQESQLQALNPLPAKAVDKQLMVELGGNMSNYVWTINDQAWPESTPLVVEKGQRVEIVFKNITSMSHPMHLHGHVFQVKSIDGKNFEGAIRDTILVTPNTTVTVQFDADNPGVWPLHCHIVYHLEAGMFTVVRYDGFQQPLVDQGKKLLTLEKDPLKKGKI